MPERDGYIPGVPCWVDTSQPDPEAAVDFYGGLFGWEFEDVMPPESGQVLHRRGFAAATSPPSGRSPRARRRWRCGTPTSGSRARTRPRPRSATPAARSLTEPFDVMDAGRMAVFADPEGAAFCVWQAKEHKGAQVVNERGSLNFNGLNTRDVEGAKAFYGSVFGWRTWRLDGGAEMWTLPGYGDHLEQTQPRPPQADGRGRRSARASRTSWRASTRSPTTSRTSRRTGT